jgi:alkanesulfonate monooxygenase SsuD/methylene tetrahydromethanopterin reductase-like flavin-dependent oxidoreductase (luciferase family)
LRQPVLVARQLATIAAFAPGRLTLGIGIGGEDRHEVEVCGVDPATRGRRADECLRILRGVADGSPLTFQGEFFSLHDAQIVPAPSAPIPLIIGGRSDAAVRRAARFGDGWLGIWVSPRRYAAVRDQVAGDATQIGRDTLDFEHALNVWCGFAETREAARGLVAAQMQAFYRSPFEQFERYSPYGTPGDVAEFLAPYIEAGCSTFNVIPCASDDESAIAAIGQLRSLLTTSHQPAIGASSHDRAPSGRPGRWP